MVCDQNFTNDLFGSEKGTCLTKYSKCDTLVQLSSVHSFHGTVDGQWEQGVAIKLDTLVRSQSVYSLIPMVQWDRMDSVGIGCNNWDTLVQAQSVHSIPWWDGQWGQCVASGTLWHSPNPSIPSHGTMGWDGQ